MATRNPSAGRPRRRPAAGSAPAPGASTGKARPPARVRARDEQGRSVSLASLPLVAYACSCGHLGRDYAISKGDQVFCEPCGTTRRVARILAQ